MHLLKIEVKNYRLLKKFSINLEEELSVIIGKNNTGKTSILNILQKTIGDKEFSFSIYDFNIDFQKELYKKIIEGNHWEEDGIVVDYYIEYNDEDCIQSLSPFILDLDPDNKTIIIRFSCILTFDNFEKLKIDFSSKTSSFESFEEYLKPLISKYFKYERRSVLYDNLNKAIDENKNCLINDIDSIRKMICFNYISAKRDISNTESDSTLSSLSSKYFNKFYLKNDFDEDFTEYSRELDRVISETSEKLTNTYEKIFGKITSTIKKFGGFKDNESEIKIVSEMKKENLLRNNTTVKYKEENHTLLPENYNGLGYLNLFNILFELEIKLSIFKCDGYKEKSIASINILYIEEPEAHTHPQMQYIFIKNIKDMLREGCKTSEGNINLQTMISTHSSHITCECEFKDIKYLIKDGHSVISKNLRDLEKIYENIKDKDKGINQEAYYRFLKQYLTLNRCEMFFADKLIIIEGDTERILLPLMLKKIDLKDKSQTTPLMSQNISIIEVGAHSKIFAPLLEFLKIKTLIITDLDCVDAGGKAQKYTESITTSNSSLIYFFGEELTSDIEKLVKLGNEKKTFNISNGVANKDINGKVRICYQTEEENYVARSFEDCFLAKNYDFIDSNIDSFTGLKNKSKINDEYENDFYNIAKNCISKKTNFAIDIIYNSKEDLSNWKIPEYIEEGLLWLKEN